MAPRRWKLESRCVLEFLLELGHSITTSTGVSHALCIFLMMVQSVSIHLFLVKYMSKWVLMTLVVEVPLLAYMLWHWRGEAAYRSNPTTWTGYCWVHAGKVVVLFVRVMPRLPNAFQQQLLREQEVQDLGGLLQVDFDQLFTPTMLGNLLYITPVVYALLMFRTSRAIFGKFSNNVTLDLILHYDMLWHVAIDMVDQVDMLSYARVAEWIDKTVYAESHNLLVLLQTLVPFLLFVSMVLQAQAFPGVGVDQWKIPRTSPNLRVSLHYEQGPRLSETQQQMTGVPRRSERSVTSSDHAVTPAEGPTNTEDGEQQRCPPSPPPAEPPPAPMLGHLAPGPTPADGPAFESLMPPLEQDAATNAPPGPPQSGQQNSALSASATPSVGNSRNRLRLPVLSRPLDATADSTGVAPPGLGIRVSRTAVALSSHDVGTHRKLAPGVRENMLRHERDRRRKLQAIVHAIRRQSIIIARKRSAMVSIFFTDVPFLAVRLAVWLLIGNNVYFHGIMIKNVICIVLNIMQYTLVRYASSASSRDIQEQLTEYSVRFEADGDCDALQGNIAGGVMLQSTPSEVACSNMSTPEGQAAERERIKRMRTSRQAAESKVQRERVRSPGVCVYFWAMVIPFAAGFLLAKGERYIMLVFQQLRDLTVDKT